MNKIELAFLLTTLAGLSTILGLFPILIPLKDEKKVIISGLAFAAGVMLCVSITDLIPESITLLETNINGFLTCLFSFLFIFLGINTSSFIEKKIEASKQNNSLYKVGIISMIAIILHNIPEGIITFTSTNINTSLGISLTIAIALHNIPEGISISIPIYYATKNKLKAILYTSLSALSEPLGALLTYYILFHFINNLILGLLFSYTAGIMIHISMTELLKTSYQYQNKTRTNIFFIIGIIFILLKIILIQ